MRDDQLIRGLDVSRETLGRLEIYEALLRKWNPKINLVARSTLSEIWQRHIQDSAQLAPMVNQASTWADIGSGGGFPGLVIAVILAEIRPDAKLTLIESDIRKCTFLIEAARTMGVDVEVIASRIEEISNRQFDIVSARALAPLPRLLPLAAPLLKTGGTCIFMKGVAYASELDEARKEWHFTVEEQRSLTNADAVVLSIEDLRRV